MPFLEKVIVNHVELQWPFWFLSHDLQLRLKYHAATLISDFPNTCHNQEHCIYHFVINKCASTCIMPNKIWKDLNSPELVTSTITLWSYHGEPSQSKGCYQNVPISLDGKKILIYVEFVDAQLDYNIPLGRNFMYVMNTIESSVFLGHDIPLQWKCGHHWPTIIWWT